MAILLLGNGINQKEGLAPSWDKLLKQIAKEHGCRSEDSLSNILSYEMLENQILKRGTDETELKIHRKIAAGLETDKLKKMRDWSGTLHAALMALPVRTVFTTNYDYALERSLEPDFKPRRNTTETVYSLRRYQDSGGKRFFHIHGECAYPRSICLGYEQYAGTLQRIREQIVQNTAPTGGGHTYQLADIMRGLTVKPEASWIYDFFLDDIYILGLGLDVSELDLWWLLSYRSKQMAAKRLPISNRVVFLDTGSDTVKDEVPDCQTAKCDYKVRAVNEKKQARKRKKTLLEAFDVEYEMCAGDTFDEQYDDAVKYLRRNCR